MGTLHCLALIVYLEARNQPEITQTHIASFAIEKAASLGKSVCETIKVPKLYSWNWDGKSTAIDKALFEKKTKLIVRKEMNRKYRTLTGYNHFSTCGKQKFPGRVMKSNDICFYTGK